MAEKNTLHPNTVKMPISQIKLRRNSDKSNSQRVVKGKKLKKRVETKSNALIVQNYGE